MTNDQNVTHAPKRFPCAQCGASLTFSPGMTSLVCEHCGYSQKTHETRTDVGELDYNAWLEKGEADEHLEDIMVVRCTGCGASLEPKKETVALPCPFCGNAMDLHEVSHRQIKPSSLLPFKVDKKQAREHFKQWVASRWFAPSKLKVAARGDTPLNGLYVPYWAYNAQTDSQYQGQRGIHYQERETYTTTENGQTVQKNRTVTRTRWYPVAGQVSHWFGNVLVMASDLLPAPMADALEPWDLENLVAYDSSFVSGFRAQSYHVGLADGFGQAKGKMAGTIDTLVRQDIGGDEQQVNHVSTQYSAVTFKHILLPIWLSTYRFGNKEYRFLINARSGEVQGERPYSWIKITATVLSIVGILGGLWWKYGEQIMASLQ
ncbi:MAG: hypothetical protein HQL78_08930 [Magnetococcales bacterium]|nr:hypothetical protein [Magnetococcales bacterium]MBF0420273.1 hypothetical protein [Magnetococcales bacterium]